MWGAFKFFGRQKGRKSNLETVDVVEPKPKHEIDYRQDKEIDLKEGNEQEPEARPWEDHQTAGTNGGVEAGVVARSGKKLEPKTQISSREEIIIALKTVYDPEIPVDIYELGLIYEINIEIDGNVKLVMSLTAPGCPVAGILPQQVADAAASVEGVGEVEVTLVWDPPWDMDKMSEDAKLALDMF